MLVEGNFYLQAVGNAPEQEQLFFGSRILLLVHNIINHIVWQLRTEGIPEVGGNHTIDGREVIVGIWP